MLDDDILLRGHDFGQIHMMQEMCIRVDHDDNVLGPVSKKTCHLNTSIQEGMLHRAFSVFLFNTEGKLLLQQRADCKVTFPGYWTNTCCSHPVYDVDPANVENHIPISGDYELEAKDFLGVKRAAKRKLWHELGIKGNALPPVEDFHYITRLHYCSLKGSDDGIWGEHEIDYIIFLQRNVELDIRPSEVKDTKYVTKEELREFIATAESRGIRLTPWFKLIVDNFIYRWWDSLMLGTIEKEYDQNNIHRMLD